MVTFSDEPSEGTWTLYSHDAHVIRGEFEMLIPVRVGNDSLTCQMRWRGRPDTVWVSFTLERVQT